MIPPISLLLLALALSSTVALCPQGQIPINDNCTTCDFIQGCVTYNAPGKCIECEFNYILLGNICDYQESDKAKCCLSFGADGECNKCQKGLFLRNGGCQQANLVGCLEKQAENCINCANGFYLSNNRCLKAVKGCSSYTANGTCQSCISSLSLSQGICQEILISGCKSQANGVCQQCFSPFKVVGGICGIDNCLTVSDFGCGVCKPGFFLKSDGLCYLSDPFCSLYRGGVCVACRSPFVMVSGLCKVDGCTSYDSTGACIQCTAPSKVSNGICQVDNCQQSLGGICKICQSGYHLHSGLCLKPLENCIDSVYEVCRMCAPGFYLGADTHCHPYVSGCVYKSGLCSSCYSPFTFGASRGCYIEGCLEYSSTGCSKCLNSNFLLSDGICRLPLCANIINNKCKDCVKGYILRSDSCVAIDQNCLTLDNNNYCNQCKPGFYLDTTGICKLEAPGSTYINGSIVSCREPFFLNPSKRTCVIDGCTEYFDGGCKTCPVPYVLDYNNCKLPNCTRSSNGVCLQCDQKFIVINGLCKTMDPYCAIYSSNVCTACVKDFFLTTFKSCIRSTPGCLYTGETCTSCLAPFIFASGTCTIEGCQQYNSKGCAECKYPYEQNCAGVCVIPNCLQTSNGLCVKCGPGFHAKKGICESNDLNCLSYSNNGNCAECIKGFAILNDGNCHLKDIHCLSFDQMGSCLSCDSTYYINKFQTCSVRQQGCKTYNNGVCGECQDRFYLWNDLCKPFTKGCASYQKGVCVSCLLGYTLDTSKGICFSAAGKVTYNDIDMDFDFQDTFNDLGFKTINRVVSQTSLVSISSIATLVYSSVWDLSFTNPQISETFVPCGASSGWKAKQAQVGGWVGYRVPSARTFYQVVLQSGPDGAYINSIDIEYTLDGTTYKRLGQQFDTSASATGTATINFKAIYALEIRIVVLGFVTWPSCRFEFFASTLNQALSPTGVSDSEIGMFISSNVDNRLNSQAASNLLNFFNPARDCSQVDTCWAGVEFCEAKTVKALHIQNGSGVSAGTVDQYYVDYTVDGTKFLCFSDCKPTTLQDLDFNAGLTASKIRIHPTKWTGSPSVKFTFTFA